ncbi:MAG: sulfite exporter TauE/SafE family protein, partial [Propionibacteriaceae bacterium]|nr:sulfite exporter TauE/SafE family protein [Propionibacteriaceae bacterium]
MAAAALVVGVSKTSISGLGSLAVAAFALVLPAKESTAAVLLLLITGDIVAVSIYRRAADWGQLKRLLPAVVPGIVLGAVFMKYVSDKVLLIVVAVTLIVAVGLQIGMRVVERRKVSAAAPVPVGTARSYLPAVGTGLAAGFTTMVANAAGAVMALYLLAIKADKLRFVATGAWYFL